MAEHGVGVWRRGQTVLLALTTSPALQLDTHTLHLHFRWQHWGQLHSVPVCSMGARPSVSQGTLVVLPLNSDTELDLSRLGEWGVQQQQARGPVTVLQVLISARAPVGAYRLTVVTGVKGEPGLASRYTLPSPVYILFNPWCTGQHNI